MLFGGGKLLNPYWRDIVGRRPEFGPDGFTRYFARKQDCEAWMLKPRCTPNQPTRRLSRSRFEGARQMARDIATTGAYTASRCARKKGEMLFAHLKRILGPGRLGLRGPCGAQEEADALLAILEWSNDPPAWRREALQRLLERGELDTRINAGFFREVWVIGVVAPGAAALPAASS